ncbi:class I SAM-dependent methyltransferase [Telmatospirillum sp.]|uniref:class I SAM-dependent methyltransferase n=1 Tax=Telmatospirillum sp. TaxID=2079197 RepID=UPI0028418248|nr:class I SAM-dependent methyltransferase [Telmatospirillum sp.]MDR3436049.1 class I SAM-dependent methyltransferase [Telmatospirillum sp.]
MSAMIERESGRTVFGADARGYTDARPDYPARVYEILRDVCHAGPTVAAFEIGAGTGQATGPLLDLGCRVTAIEPDPRLAAVLGDRLKERSAQLDVHVAPFEDASLASSSFDLGVAAMSLHWLEPKAALAKANDLLRPGGWWAMWWTVFGDPTRVDEFHDRTQFLFKGLERSPSQGDDPLIPFSLDRDRRIAELEDAGFESISFEEIRWTPTLNKQQVLALTATFSPVARLPKDERKCFLDEMGRVVDETFGGRVSRNFVTAIYTAARPGR